MPTFHFVFFKSLEIGKLELYSKDVNPLDCLEGGFRSNSRHLLSDQEGYSKEHTFLGWTGRYRDLGLPLPSSFLSLLPRIPKWSSRLQGNEIKVGRNTDTDSCYVFLCKRKLTTLIWTWFIPQWRKLVLWYLSVCLSNWKSQPGAVMTKERKKKIEEHYIQWLTYVRVLVQTYTQGTQISK